MKRALWKVSGAAAVLAFVVVASLRHTRTPPPSSATTQQAKRASPAGSSVQEPPMARHSTTPPPSSVAMHRAERASPVGTSHQEPLIVALVVLGRLVVTLVFGTLIAFVVLRVWQSTALRSRGQQGQRYVERIAHPWCVLSDWMERRSRQRRGGRHRRDAERPHLGRCRVCGYMPPAELCGAIFMGPGGLNWCPKCEKIYCNQHARRIDMGSFFFLNGPECGEQMEPL